MSHAILAGLLACAPAVAAAQVSFGGAAGVLFADGGGFLGVGPRPAVWALLTTHHRGRFGPEAAVMFTPFHVLGANVALGADVGGTYHTAGGAVWLGLGGTALLTLGSGDTRLIPGGYITLTWVPTTLGKLAFMVQGRQRFLVYQGESLRYPSVALGLTTR